MDQKHFFNISLFRIVATICVIQFHIVFVFANKNPDLELLLSKGVIGLTALSGFLYGRKRIENVKSFLGNRILRILVPALFGLALMATWNLIYWIGNQNLNYGELWFGRRRYGGGLLFQAANYYYIGYIILCYLLVLLLNKRNKYLNIILIILCLIGEGILSYFYFFSFIVTAFIVGYLIGEKYFLKYVDPLEENINHTFVYFVLTTSFLAAFLIINYFPFEVTSELSNIVKLGQEISLDGFGIFFFFLFINTIKSLNWSYFLNQLKFIDKIAYPMFLLDLCFMVGAMNIGVIAPNYDVMNLVIYIFIIFFSAFIYFEYWFFNYNYKYIKQRKSQISFKSRENCF